MKVLLIRHGMTAGNARRRYIGRTDEPLSDEGIAAAQAAGGNAALRQVYVSPMRRARQTAAILFPNAEQVVIDDLREMDFGDFENRSADEMAFDPAYRAWVEGNCLGRCPNGEATGDFTRRVRAAFERAVAASLAAGAETAVFVVHGGCIMAVLETFARPAMSFYDGYVGNGRGYLAAVSTPAKEDPLPFVLTELTKVERVTI